MPKTHEALTAPLIPGARRPARAAAPSHRRPWRAPALEAMPALEELTLQSPIWGGEGGFGYLDAADPARRLG